MCDVLLHVYGRLNAMLYLHVRDCLDKCVCAVQLHVYCCLNVILCRYVCLCFHTFGCCVRVFLLLFKCNMMFACVHVFVYVRVVL